MKKVVRNFANVCCQIVGLLAFAACSDSEHLSATSFDRFNECIRNAIGDPQIDESMRQSCLLKYEELTERYTFEGATAEFVEEGVLRVSLRNGYENFVVTNVEIRFIVPVDDDGDCRSDISGCSGSFAQGRTWLNPGSSGEAIIVPFVYGNPINSKGEEVWAFDIQSVRILRLE